MTALDRIAAEATTKSLGPAEFRKLVESFLDTTHVSQTKFGSVAAGNRDFVRHLKAGRDFRLSTVKRVLDHIAASAVIE